MCLMFEMRETRDENNFEEAQFLMTAFFFFFFIRRNRSTLFHFVVHFQSFWGKKD